MPRGKQRLPQSRPSLNCYSLQISFTSAIKGWPKIYHVWGIRVIIFVPREFVSFEYISVSPGEKNAIF